MAQTKINKNAARIFTAIHRRVLALSGGRFGGTSIPGGEMIVLATIGRRSGRIRERVLIGLDHPDGWAVAASFSGHDEHPAWYLNLRDNPDATVTAGTDHHRVQAREAEGEERDELWARFEAHRSDYAEYQKVTDREIPVLVLERQ